MPTGMPAFSADPTRRSFGDVRLSGSADLAQPRPTSGRLQLSKRCRSIPGQPGGHANPKGRSRLDERFAAPDTGSPMNAPDTLSMAPGSTHGGSTRHASSNELEGSPSTLGKFAPKRNPGQLRLVCRSHAPRETILPTSASVVSRLPPVVALRSQHPTTSRSTRQCLVNLSN